MTATSAATDPFDAPAYGVSFGGALVRFFRKYARFSGRASRSEYAWMILWNALLGLVLGGIAAGLIVPVFAEAANEAALINSGTSAGIDATKTLALMVDGRIIAVEIVAIVIGLAILIPRIALSVRRLHDTNRSGHFAWLILVPWVGELILLILCLMPTDPQGQRFDRPLGA